MQVVPVIPSLLSKWVQICIFISKWGTVSEKWTDNMAIASFETKEQHYKGQLSLQRTTLFGTCLAICSKTGLKWILMRRILEKGLNLTILTVCRSKSDSCYHSVNKRLLPYFYNNIYLLEFLTLWTSFLSFSYVIQINNIDLYLLFFNWHLKEKHCYLTLCYVINLHTNRKYILQKHNFKQEINNKYS